MPSIVPSIDDKCLYFVLCDFGEHGLEYVATDPDAADCDTIVENMIDGQYHKPIRVIAVDVRAGTARDASDLIAGTIEHQASLDDLPDDVRKFVVFHTGLMSLRAQEDMDSTYEWPQM